MRLSLLTLAAAAYLHAHPDAFYLAGTVSVLMYITLIVMVIAAIVALFAGAAS
jgi:hypothetical protein